MQGGKDADDVYLVTIERAGAVAASAVMTPPWPLVLSLILPEALISEVLPLLARDLHTTFGQLSGVNGPLPLSRGFAEEWSSVAGQSFRLGMRERIYQLDAVRPIAGVAGQLRLATGADRDLLVRWVDAFNREGLES